MSDTIERKMTRKATCDPKKAIPTAIARLTIAYALSPWDALLMEKTTSTIKPSGATHRLAVETHFIESAAVPLIEAGGTLEQLTKLLGRKASEISDDWLQRFQLHAARHANISLLVALNQNPSPRLLIEAAASGQLRALRVAREILERHYTKLRKAKMRPRNDYFTEVNWTSQFVQTIKEGHCTLKVLRWFLGAARGREFDATEAFTAVILRCDTRQIQTFMERTPTRYKLIVSLVDAVRRTADREDLRQKRDYILDQLATHGKRLSGKVADMAAIQKLMTRLEATRKRRRQ
ncbi:MAG: hypothetical protein KGL39_01130 [Patescibacteria group bacterium]|nr:hypothetical protein [Patescibacteria group bacterium]